MRKIIRALVPRIIKEKIRSIINITPVISLDATYSYPSAWIKERNFYGQYGEDIKILPLFEKNYSGWFVEVGAMEGARFSNTYLFELMGWKGICIEPHPDYFDLLKKNRSRSITIHAAAGREDKNEVDFYTNFRAKWLIKNV